jgi:putative ABC transport system permease protein
MAMNRRAAVTMALTDAYVSWRNVIRHGRRTAIGALAVVFGTIALIVAAGFIEWIYFAMREGTIHAGLGHLQVMRAGYPEHGVSDPFNYLLADDAPEYGRLQQVPHVRKVARRLHFTGLVAFGESSLSFLGEGRDPDNEVSGVDALIIESGAQLSNAAADGVLVGQGLAANLGVKVGDKVVLLVNKRGGALDGAEFTVRGVFSTQTKAYDDVALQIPYHVANTLLQARGAHKWVLYLDRTESTPLALPLVQAMVSNDFVVIAWYEAADFYNKTVRLFSRQVLVMKLIIALVVMLSISNTMMMAVMERIDEIGTAMALGVRRVRVLSRFLAEGLFIGLIGAMAGVVIGYLAAAGISKVGIPMPPPPGMGRSFVGEILVTPGLVFDAVILALLTALAASAYPAWKASRMVIVDALRHGR